jgi:ATP-dependent Zn protease
MDSNEESRDVNDDATVHVLRQNHNTTDNNNNRKNSMNNDATHALQVQNKAEQPQQQQPSPPPSSSNPLTRKALVWKQQFRVWVQHYVRRILHRLVETKYRLDTKHIAYFVMSSCSMTCCYLVARRYYSYYSHPRKSLLPPVNASSRSHVQNQKDRNTLSSYTHLYQQATLVPISILWNLLLRSQETSSSSDASNDAATTTTTTALQKIMIGSKYILFQDSSSSNPSTSSWKRVQLPSTSSPLLHQQIVSLLTSLLSNRRIHQNTSTENTNPTKQQPLHSNVDVTFVTEEEEESTINPYSHTKTFASTVLLSCLPFLYLALIYRIIRRSQQEQQQQSSFKDGSDINSLLHTTNTKNTKHTNNLESDHVTFADVAGIDAAVQDVKEIVQYLKCPTQYIRYGANLTRGILLYGPPGSGKTLLARALAGEIQQIHQQTSTTTKNHDIQTTTTTTCPFIACSASSFVELYVGRGASRVRNLFRYAKERAIQSYQEQQQQQHVLSPSHDAHWSTTLIGWSQKYVYSSRNTTNHSKVPTTSTTLPRVCCVAVLFIDELDALAKTRSTNGFSINSNDEREQTLNQLLTEMDGFHTSSSSSSSSSTRVSTFNDKTVDPQPIIIVIGATNRVEVLDPAILRRFDRHVHVGYPDVIGRKQILQLHTRHIPIQHRDVIDWAGLAQSSHDMSGSDLRQIVNEAALLAVREHQSSQPTSTSSNHMVTQQHIESAIQRHRMRSGQKHRST